MQPGDLGLILYTSGTTGPSKGVCCPHAQYFWWAVNTASLLQVGDGDVLCTSLPLFHTNALNTFYQALLTGACVRYEKRFSASGFFPSLVQSRATVTYLLGAMVPILLSRPVSPEETAHRVTIALAPGVPAQFHAEFTRRTGIRLLDGWGSTETNFVLGTTIEHQQPGLMGPVFEGFDARVVDDQDHDVADGTAGELIVRADEPLAFAHEYFGAPEKTVEAWRDRWFHTGDRVVRQADGYFRFVDRLKDAIRRRGENISSFEVEQVLLSHPAVANAAAFPVRSAACGGRGDGSRHSASRPHAQRSRADRVLRAAAALFRGAALSRIRQRAAEHRERQGAEIQIARTRRNRQNLGPRGRRRTAQTPMTLRSAMTPAMPHIFPTVLHMLAAAGDAAPERVALRCGEERLTYREYVSCVAGFAAALGGEVRGGRVALVMANSIDAAVATFAILAAERRPFRSIPHIRHTSSVRSWRMPSRRRLSAMPRCRP